MNYQRLAPEPFTADVHEDILGDLARIGRTTYKSELDLHIDLSRSVKRLMDGHCVYVNMCFDSLFLSFVPLPVVLLTDSKGNQAVHIAPEAFTVATAEFPDQIDVWQNSLPGKLKGQLASVWIFIIAFLNFKLISIGGSFSCQAPRFLPSMARIRSWQLTPMQRSQEASKALALARTGEIDIRLPSELSIADVEIAVRHGYSFFSSYQRVDAGWNYVMGNFAQMSLPLADSVSLTVQRVNSSTIDTFSVRKNNLFAEFDLISLSKDPLPVSNRFSYS